LRFTSKQYDDLMVYNTRNQAAGSLTKWWCDKCGRALYYPRHADTPQCPYCYSSQGLLHPMRKYFTVPDLSKIGGS